MNKKEFIEKRGEAAWNEHLAKLRERYKLNPASRRNAAKNWKLKNDERNKQINKDWKVTNPDKVRLGNRKTYLSFCIPEEYELIENYQFAKADNFKGWVCHHRLELHPDFSVRFTRTSLKKLDLYYNRPASELIFLTNSQHTQWHIKHTRKDYN